MNDGKRYEVRNANGSTWFTYFDDAKAEAKRLAAEEKVITWVLADGETQILNAIFTAYPPLRNL